MAHAFQVGRKSIQEVRGRVSKAIFSLGNQSYVLRESNCLDAGYDFGRRQCVYLRCSCSS